jgi:hypothetical protein
MTKLEFLGNALPGELPLMRMLSGWTACIEQRGAAKVLTWRSAPPNPEKPYNPEEPSSRFSSLPKPVSVKRLERGQQRLMARDEGEDPSGPVDPYELLVAFAAIGGRVQSIPTRGEKTESEALDDFLGGAGALDDFILLGDAPDEELCCFASHWGPLGVCHHRKPWTHSLTRRSMFSIEPVCTPLGIGSPKGEIWEPIDIWKDYSQKAREIVLDAVALKNSRKREYDRLASAFEGAASWLEEAAVSLIAQPKVDVSKPWPCGFTMTPSIGSVFQVIALQLAALVAGGRDLAQCFHCGYPFVLTGHREGDKRFCSTCVEKKIAGRYAAKAYRERRKGERREIPE